MLKCCKNSFAICDEFIGCPESLVIKVPTEYPEESIIVRLYKNGKVAFDIEGEIDGGGFVTIPLEELPDGFVNPFGATYSIQFILFTTLKVFEFMVDGSLYDSVEFNLINGTSYSPNFIINIF
jgi:hypothetical protein